jgi:hypothetical protein
MGQVFLEIKLSFKVACGTKHGCMDNDGDVPIKKQNSSETAQIMSSSCRAEQRVSISM